MAALPLDDDQVSPRFVWERLAGAAVVVACVLVVLWLSDPGIDLWRWPPRWGPLFQDTTTNGGDMGAHVYWPAFLRDNWFGRFRLSGWSPDWYAGFPIGQFYFPLPALLIALLDLVMPYNVAFKLVTVSGPLLLPAAAYVFARGLRAPWPAPPAFAVATVAVLVQTRDGWQIYGGNLPSNLAGEFSYTLGLALALFFLGTLARTLEYGRRPWLPTLLLAGAILSHIVVAVLAAVGGIAVWLVRRPHRTWPLALTVGGVAALLTAVWTLPLVARSAYTQSMRYEKVTLYAHNLNQPMWMWFLAGVAVVAAGWWRRGATLVLVVLTASFAALFRVWPADQHVWNTRFLPFYLYSFALLCAMGAVELVRVVAHLSVWAGDWIRAGDLEDALARVASREGDAGADSDSDLGAPTPEPEWQPPSPPEFAPVHVSGPQVQRRRALVMSVVLLVALAAGSAFGLNTAWNARDNNPDQSFVGWARWNYSGYESKPAWPEYKSIMDVMGGLPPGRALWEPSAGESDPINTYGTSLALELLPYFTDGRIKSMEGLYFESSATTAFHFMTVSEVASRPSNPVRGLVYGTLADFDRGVRHLQMMGVRYYMAWTTEAQSRADANAKLSLVAEIPDKDGLDPKGWKVYEVADAPLVEGLRYEPVIARVHAGTQSECFDSAAPPPGSHDPELGAWECAAVGWWRDVTELDRPFAASGPDNWETTDAADLSTMPFEELPAVEISRINEDVDRMAFRVSRTGVPVLVKTSYFPNWTAHGAKGPYRVSPNFMVVIPTSKNVSLTYDRTTVDWIGILLALAGAVGLLRLVVWRPPTHMVSRPDEDAAGRGREAAATALPWAHLLPESPGDPAIR